MDQNRSVQSLGTLPPRRAIRTGYRTGKIGQMGLYELLQRPTPALWLTLLVCLGNLPFLGQAFHIDDRIYLEIAENTLEKPFFPYDYVPVFEGFTVPDAASHSHLPLTSYYLALIRWVTGSQSEWVYHLAFLVFPLMAAWGFYDLSRRYVRSPLAASCLLVLAPGFYVLSHTLMTEVPLLAFWIVSLASFLRITDGFPKAGDWVICGGSLLAASFISLLAAGLLLLMGAYFLLRRLNSRKGRPRLPRGWKVLLLLSLPVILWVSWYLRAYLHYDRFVLVHTFLHVTKRGAFSPEVFAVKVLSLILNLGGALLLPVALWLGFLGRTSIRIFLGIFLLSGLPFYFWVEGWSNLQVLLFQAFFSSGLIVIWHFGCRILGLSDYWKRLPGAVLKGTGRAGSGPRAAEEPPSGSLEAESSDTLQVLLVFWFLGILASYLFLYYSGAVRYLLLALPPVVLWWVNSFERLVNDPYLRRNLMVLIVLLSGLQSGFIAYGDYLFAETYRTAAREIADGYARPGRVLWFAGEWGFRYYLEREGGQVLMPTDPAPNAGDIIVKPRLATPWATLYDDPEYSEFIEQRYAAKDYPVRLLDSSSSAAFYSTGWGVLPYSLSPGGEWEWFYILEVKKKYDGQIPDPESPF